MIIDKNITLDLNRVQPLKVIRIHQGDVNSVNIVINVTNENKSVDLTGKAVKYDATISNILAEQDAHGSISGSKITIPITKNMTAHSGLLKVDVKIIEGITEKSILYTQTLTLIVERSVINGDTIIDASKTTIEQKLNDFELRLEGLVSDIYSKSEVDEKLESYYTKPQTDSLIANKVNHVFVNDATEENCDRFTDWNTMYHLYINGVYQLLLNTSSTGCQYRFTRSGDVFYRTYNLNESTWNEWNHLSKRIPSNTITNDMIIDETISYGKLTDDYIRYFGNFNLDNLDTVGELGIYSGTANDYWINNYEVYGNFTLLFTNSQLLFFTDCNRIFVRHRANSGYWLNWNDISPSKGSSSGNALTQETGAVGENHAWYTDQGQGYSLTGTYHLIGDMCFLCGKTPLISGWERVYYSLPVTCVSPSTTLATYDSNIFTISTGTINNISVLELKNINSSLMPSGEISFTLIYKYK